MDGFCYRCGKYGATERHHLIGGNGRRKLSDEDGLIVPLCVECHRAAHEDAGTNRELKREGEIIWLRQDESRTVDDFIRRYGKNWL